jgi:uncharacterized protein with HEPN domain
MRDRIDHHHFEIDLDIVWSTVTEDFPVLLTALRATWSRPRREDFGSGS